MAIATYKKELFQNFTKENSIFCHAAKILDNVAGNDNNIGEVIKDFAVQAKTQLADVIAAANNLQNNELSAEDLKILANSSFVIKTVTQVLMSTPPAMQRNNAEALFGKEKFYYKDVAEFAKIFANSPEVNQLVKELG